MLKISPSFQGIDIQAMRDERDTYIRRQRETQRWEWEDVGNRDPSRGASQPPLTETQAEQKEASVKNNIRAIKGCCS